MPHDDEELHGEAEEEEEVELEQRDVNLDLGNISNAFWRCFS